MPYGEGYRPLPREKGDPLPPISDENAAGPDAPSRHNLELKKLLVFRLLRQDEAARGPTGSFWQRWIPGVCKHERVRCTHGDEIIHRRYRRRVCMVCGRALKGDIPKMCFFTGKPHTGSNQVPTIRPVRISWEDDGDGE